MVWILKSTFHVLGSHDFIFLLKKLFVMIAMKQLFVMPYKYFWQDANDVKVIDGKIFTTSTGSTGVTVLTSTHRFYLVTNIYDVKLKQLADLPG